MGDPGAKSIDIAPLDVTQGIGDAVQFRVLRGMGTDVTGGTFAIAI